NPSVFAQLSEKDSFIGSFYEKQASGFYRLKALPAQGRERLTAHLRAAGFDAINYTDSRSNYQFYNLRSLVGHIKTALQNGIAKLNITTEPINAAELYEYIRCRPFQNNIPGAIADYDCKTIYSDIFNGRNGYIFDKSFVLEDVKRFVQGGDP
ncbi:MAG: NAD(P)-dependent oxidoreductase, partial [Clostridia bacterium]|nr:NAD(P)-dependent oxidoreductase [Clostridia bacterium]